MTSFYRKRQICVETRKKLRIVQREPYLTMPETNSFLGIFFIIKKKRSNIIFLFPRAQCQSLLFLNFLERETEQNL